MHLSLIHPSMSVLFFPLKIADCFIFSSFFLRYLLLLTFCIFLETRFDCKLICPGSAVFLCAYKRDKWLTSAVYSQQSQFHVHSLFYFSKSVSKSQPDYCMIINQNLSPRYVKEYNIRQCKHMIIIITTTKLKH